MRLALFQPDIPPNTGTMLRLCACLDLAVDVIEPCGFPFSEAALRRAGMDYLPMARITRHLDWAAFLAAIGHETSENAAPSGPRIILLTTRAAVPYTEFAYQKDDILMVGQESAGAPPEVHKAAAARVRIPMQPGARSLNVALSAAMVLGEALRQTAGWPQDPVINKEQSHVG